MKRRYFFFLLLAIIIIGMFTSAGYVAGRNHFIGSIRDALVAEAKPENGSDLPPLLTADVGSSLTFTKLNAMLDSRLLELGVENSLWPALMEAQGPADQDEAAGRIRKQYLDSLAPYPETADDLNIREEFLFSKEGVDLYLVTIDTHPDVSLESVLMVPEGSQPAEKPALLVLHGYDGNFQSLIEDVGYHHGFGFEIAKNGFVVLAPLQAASTVDTHSTLNIKALASGINLETLNLQQLFSAVDYLDTLDFVDKERIGVYGISLGGQHALRLGALDERLSSVVISGYFTDRFDWLFKRSTASATSPPGKEMAAHIHPYDHLLLSPDMKLLLDDLNLVALIVPRNLYIVSGHNDPRHEAAAREFEKVAELYDHLGHPERTAFIEFDGNHETSLENTLPYILEWARSEPITLER